MSDAEGQAKPVFVQAMMSMRKPVLHPHAVFPSPIGTVLIRHFKYDADMQLLSHPWALFRVARDRTCR